jgi:hypothetical protein
MKSQLMTALSIVGVLGTATTAMAVNTDALSNLDPSAIGNATDTLLPGTQSTSDPAGVTDPAVPSATPAPSDPSVTADPVATPEARRTEANEKRSNTVTPAQAPAVVQPAQVVTVNGTSGGSGSRVEPVPASGVVPAHQEDDHDGEQEHEGEADD